MFVFGEVQDPTPETVNLVEDIVRSQIIELVRIASLSVPEECLLSCVLDNSSSKPREPSWSALSVC